MPEGFGEPRLERRVGPFYEARQDRRKDFMRTAKKLAGFQRRTRGAGSPFAEPVPDARQKAPDGGLHHRLVRPD